MRKRRRSRELALQGLYAEEVSGNNLDIVLDRVASDGNHDKEVVLFASELIKKAVAEKSKLDKEMTAVVENWEFERIALVDRLIVRMALCELLHFHEIPPKVTINEAIELAKTYSTLKSGRFVNGILDSLYKKFKSEKKIKKKGRGLVS